MNKIMILGGSVLQLPAIIQAKEMGLHVITVDMDENCIGFKHSDEKLVISTLDYQTIKKYIEQNPINGILTLASDRPVNVVAKIGEEFNLNAVSIDAAKKSTNKAMMRRALENTDVTMPRFFITSTIDDFLQTMDQIDFSVIIKSSDNSGKRGIMKLNENATINEKKEAFYYAYENSISKEVLIEELIVGKEYSVESITYNGETSVIAVTNKFNSGEPYFVEIGHSQPADITYEQYIDVENIVKKTIKALGINNTASHTEVMINNQGVYLIEIGPRLGGDNISTSLVKLSSGVDMVKASIQMSMNIKPEIDRVYNRGSAILYLLPSYGIYNGIETVDNFTKSKDFYEFVITKDKGYNMTKLTNSNDRLGYVIFGGKNSKDAETKALNALKSIKIVTKTK